MKKGQSVKSGSVRGAEQHVHLQSQKTTKYNLWNQRSTRQYRALVMKEHFTFVSRSADWTNAPADIVSASLISVLVLLLVKIHEHLYNGSAACRSLWGISFLFHLSRRRFTEFLTLLFLFFPACSYLLIVAHPEYTLAPVWICKTIWSNNRCT